MTWHCRQCGASEWGWTFWRIRNTNGGHVTDRPNRADAFRLVRTYAWAKGCKVYRVTVKRKNANCYWPPHGAEKRLREAQR